MHIRNSLASLQRVGLQACLGPLPLLQLLLLAGCTSFGAQPVAESAPPIASGTQDTLSLAEPQARSMMEAVGKATAASRNRDYGATLRYLEQAERIAPGHPQLLEQIARFRLRVGDTAAALSALQRLAQVGRKPPLDEDSTYAALQSYPEFQVAADIAREAARTVAAGDTAFLSDEPDLLVEAIAHERLPSGILRVYIGSMATGRILTFDASAAGPTAVTEFVRHDGRVLGMRVDSAGRLWVNVWRPALVPPQPGHPVSTSTLYVHAAGTQRVLQRFRSPTDSVAHLFNDLVVGDGEAWLTDSDAGRVYHADLRTGALTPVLPDQPDLTYPNGLVRTRDGSRLYVAHAEGMSLVDLATHTRSRITHPAHLTLTGIDGLYRCGNGLLAVQRLAGFERIALLELSPDGQRVIASRVVEQAHPAYRQPTTGALVGDTLYYVATSELRRHRPDGSIAPAAAPSHTLILRVPVRCG